MPVLDTVGTVFRKVFGSRNERIVKRFGQIAEQINAFEPEMRGDFDARFAQAAATLSPDLPPDDLERDLQRLRVEHSGDLLAKARQLRERIAGGETTESILPEAFATLREASRRARNHRHFDCQLIGGQVLYSGTIAEMKTGEGKTIVCHLAAFLKALEGKKVHTVTVNDYLVKRDAEFAMPIFELVGMTVGYIQSQLDPGGREGIRAKAYACNITYGTNNEFGFDYLRDNMKTSLEEQVQGRLDFAIVDEVDSILIDEARTPLIISGPAEDDVTRYRTADAVARVLLSRQAAAQADTLRRIKEWGDNIPREFSDRPKFTGTIAKFKTDATWINEEEAEAIGHQIYYVVAKERKSVSLTHAGVSIAQEQLGVGSLYVGDNMEWPHLVENSVRAHIVYNKDVDYAVKDGEIIIVDSFTGRLMIGRQWSDGLHQAVEAKEGVRVKEESQTLATITLQNFFKLYKNLAGMTGTAMTEADEFAKIYKLDVVAIPTNRPVNRVDHHDRIYKTVDDKYNAIVEEIYDIHSKGRPRDPFVLEPILKNLKPIVQRQNRPTERIDKSLAEFKGGKGTGEGMADAYDDAMGDLARGRPVLVGTISIENSEKLSNLLTRKHAIDHEVLNAKQHAREAEIVTKAGETHERTRGREKERVGNVTIATNMAGRGTDIKLQRGVVWEKCVGDLGPPPNADGRKFGWHESGVIGTKCCIHCPDYDPKTNCAHCWKPKVDPRFPAMGRNVCALNSPCGLHIVGTERHESRRIDNQLRGRSGRQGDPGSSRFFLSLGDDLLRLFMGDWMLKMLERMGFEEGMAIEAKSINKGIERAQKKVEEKNFGIRKHLLEYDEVMDHQRKIFYTQRQEILSASLPGRSARMVEVIWRMIDATTTNAATRFLDRDYAAKCVVEWAKAELECTIDAKRIDMEDRHGTELLIRDNAKEEARNAIMLTVGEYMDPDVEPAQWDIRGLAKWGETRFGAKITQNQLKTMDVEDVKQSFLDASEVMIDNADLRPIERFFDPLYGKKTFLDWAQRKFGVELQIEGFEEMPHDQLSIRLRDAIRAAYREREARYPVEWILDRTLLNERSDSAYSADSLAQWANFKFALNWTVDDIRTRPPDQVADELYRLNQDYSSNGKLEAEIDAAIQSNGGDGNGRLLEWGKKRFGPAFDQDTYDRSANPRDALLIFGHDLIRRELTVLERYVLLQIYDQAWKEHMHAIDILKDSIGLRGYAEQDPKIAYKKEGFAMFKEMQAGIEDKVTGIIFRARLADESVIQNKYRIAAARHAEATNQGFSGQVDRDRAAAMQAQNQQQKIETIRRDQPRVGRNDPCHCGSGKKFKQCHGKTA
ncbi:MAG TPA: SEC-C metal-binding domain-containing protein [Phycisphaerae bacterium]|nr:SEC-C metal-binding domain-containing protein [Phycisphaerae bacterium]